MEEQPQLTKTEGRFETYTGKNEYDLYSTTLKATDQFHTYLHASFFVANLEHANTSDKATQNDYISMLKECDIFRYQQQHPDQFRPFGTMKLCSIDHYCFR